MGLVGAEFQVVFDLPPGVYQVRRCSDCSDSARSLLCGLPWLIAFVLCLTVCSTAFYSALA